MPAPPRSVVLVACDDVQALDLSGPVEVVHATGGSHLTVAAAEPG